MNPLKPETPLPLVSRAEVDFLDQMLQRLFELLFNPHVVSDNIAAECRLLLEVYELDYTCRTAPERPSEPHSPRITGYWQRYRPCTSGAERN